MVHLVVTINTISRIVSIKLPDMTMMTYPALSFYYHMWMNPKILVLSYNPFGSYNRKKFFRLRKFFEKNFFFFAHLKWVEHSPTCRWSTRIRLSGEKKIFFSLTLNRWSSRIRLSGEKNIFFFPHLK